MIRCEYSESNKHCKEKATRVVIISHHDIKDPAILSYVTCDSHKTGICNSINHLKPDITYKNLVDIEECYLCHGGVDINSNMKMVKIVDEKESLYSHLPCEKEYYNRFDKNLCTSCGKIPKDVENGVYCLCCGEMYIKRDEDRKFSNFKKINCESKISEETVEIPNDFMKGLKHVKTIPHGKIKIEPFSFNDLRYMKDGWMNGEGVAPKPRELDWLSKMLKFYYPDKSMIPYVYPMLDGGVSLEWSIGTYEVSLEINLDKHSGEWDCYDTFTKTNDEKTLDLNNPDDWSWMLKQLQQLWLKYTIRYL